MSVGISLEIEMQAFNAVQNKFPNSWLHRHVYVGGLRSGPGPY